MYRVFDAWDERNETLNVPDDFGITFGELAGRLKTENPKVKINLLGKSVVQNLRENDRILRERYGWFPKISVISDLEYLMDTYGKIKEPETGKWEILKNWIRGHRRIWKSAEMLVSFCVSEILGRVMGNQVQFRMIDVRLLFIVLMGTVFGMNMGIAAAGLASISLLMANIRQGVGLLTMFYEPMNWIPFISYFIIGAVCGYVQLKNQDTIRFMKRDNELLREKVFFIKSLYHDLIKEKRELKKQILGSRDSFGKIFDITKQLDTVQPQEVFITAVRIMEEVLENQTISIYSVGKNKDFARLEIASKGILQILPRTIKLREYEEIMNVLKQEKVWANIKVEEHKPMYAAGIRKNSSTVMLMLIQEADYSQMTLYYQNLIQILCGLIETALLRALNYQEAMYEKQYLREGLF